MSMPHAASDWTAAQIRALPDDGRRYEAVDGELLVTPAPRPAHQLALQALFERIAPYVRAHGLGTTFLSPADVELDERTLVQPDLFVVPPLEGGGRIDEWNQIGGRLLLAVEVVSPSTARADRILKRLRYQRAGIPEYWVVDLDARLVERWRPEDERPEVLDGRLEWRAAPGSEPLAIDLPGMFAEVLGEE